MKKLTVSLFLFLFVSGAITTTAATIINVKVKANKILYDKKRDKIYASIKSSDPVYGNNFISINPTTGAVIQNIYVGSDPTNFVFTSDTDFVFICFYNLSKIKKIDLNTFAIVDEILIANNQYNDAQVAISLATVKDSNNIVIAALGDVNSQYNQSIVAYENGVKLPATINSVYYANVLVSTGTDTIYGYNSYTSGYDLSGIKVSFSDAMAKGVYTIFDNNTNYGGRNFEYHNRFLYSNIGYALDANYSPPFLDGKYNITNNPYIYGSAVEADINLNKVFFVFYDNSDYKVKLQNFKLNTYTSLSVLDINSFMPSVFNSSAYPTDLIRVGRSSLAFTVNKNNYNNYPSDTLSTVFIFTDTAFVGIESRDYNNNIGGNCTTYDTVLVHVEDTLNIRLSILLSTNQLVNGEIKVYPNIISHLLQVEIQNNLLPNNYRIDIYNSIGALQFTSSINTSLIQVNVSGYANGIYYLKIYDNNNVLVATKFLKIN